MNKKLKILLNKLSQENFFKTNQAVWIGGTAIAYYTDHRVSMDLDICFAQHSKLPKLTFLDKYDATLYKFDSFIIDSVVNDGGDIEDYHKRYIIDGIKAKKEDVLDIKENTIINPKMNMWKYNDLRDYLIKVL